MTAGSPSLHEVLRGARDTLTAAGLSESWAAIDVDVLARHLLDWDRARLLVSRNEPAPDGFATALATLVRRRAAREPVAYIVGRREFWGLDFEVTADVLIPRPETEIVVEEALAILEERRSGGAGERGRSGGTEERRSGGAGPLVIDVGTGSGCVAIAIAVNAPDARVVATDASTRALRIAARNGARLAPSRVGFVAGDLLAPFRPEPFVDLFVSNPPYVPRGAGDVMVDVARYEPPVALYGGADGLEMLRRLVGQASHVVRPGGWLVSEFGDGQEDDVVALVRAAGGWSIERVRHDLQDIPRVIVAQRSGATGE